MTDSSIVRYSGQYIRNATGGTAGGAKLYVVDEGGGINDLKSIYTDAALSNASNNPVVADSAGLMPFAYIGTGTYKVILTEAGGSTIDTEDAIPGALDTSTFAAATYAKVDEDVATKSSDYPMVAGDVGTVINANCTGTTVQITLLSAVTVGNGRGITIRHTGTSGQVKILASSAQTITSPKTGVTTTAFCLVGYGEAVTLRSDGAGWHVEGYVPPLMTPNTPGVIQIADRVSVAPSSPTPGARYIVSGAFSTYEQEDIIESDGQGAYIEYTPPTDCGWLAYVQDEDETYQFIGSAWVQLITRPASQSEMETGTSLLKAVTPGTQHFHPGHPKLWGYVTVSGGTPTLQASYNVTSITDAGAGQLTVTIATDFSSANYAICNAVSAGDSGTGTTTVLVTAQAAGTLTLLSERDDGSNADPLAWHFAGFGDHA